MSPPRFAAFAGAAAAMLLSAAALGQTDTPTANPPPARGLPARGLPARDLPARDLPKVVLVGDSIRLSYAAVVARELAGQAVVVSPPANGGDSANVLQRLASWVIGEKPAVVHFNCGIHDTKKFRATGKFQVSPEQYEANLRKIVERIRRETDAVVLFATTTPILDDRAAAARAGRDYELLGSSVEQYNAIANRVMRELQAPVNDLHAALARPAPPATTESLLGADGVHLTAAAQELLGKQVAQFVGQHLPRWPRTATLDLFEKRILPIFQAPKASSCTECHLSGVDLKNYIQPSQEKTFASLVGAGLIDVAKPDDSKILQLINRRPEKPNLITDQVRKQEFAAFQAWIRAAVQEPALLASKTAESQLSQLPVAVIRHARKDRVLASFLDNVWSEVGRCAACHSPDQNQKQVKEHGERVSWIKLGDPEATLSYIVEAGIIAPAAPLESMLLTKPTLQVEHGGGQKMVVGDRTYKQFRHFIDDYANVLNARYTRAEQLPQPDDEVSLVTDIWFKLTGVPEKHDKQLLQADLYRWTGDAWSAHRVATSDRPIFGKGRLWQHSLSLTAPRDSRWAAQLPAKRLPPGRYLVKLYIDQTGKLQKDFEAQLGDDDFVGQVEFESQWPLGYGRMTAIAFPPQK